MAHIVPDASFLCHALVRTQRTAEAQTKYLEAIMNPDIRWTTSAAVYLGFGSGLRKLGERGTLGRDEELELFATLNDLPADRYGISARLTQRAWEIAHRLRQTDVFDSFGLAVAEEVDAVLWTSDLRFFNAAAPFAPDRIEYVP